MNFTVNHRHFMDGDNGKVMAEFTNVDLDLTMTHGDLMRYLKKS